jgi:hypothetical protein
MRRTLGALLFALCAFVHADEHEHTVSERAIHTRSTSLAMQYRHGEEVVLWMNTVGPYHNRQETYTYFSLPFCRGPKQTISHYHETLGEALLGVELDFSGLNIQFGGEREVCLLHNINSCSCYCENDILLDHTHSRNVQSTCVRGEKQLLVPDVHG